MDVAPNSDLEVEAGADAGPDRGYVSVFATQVGEGSASAHGMAEDIERQESQLLDCIDAAGLEYVELTLRVTWSQQGIAAGVIADAEKIYEWQRDHTPMAAYDLDGLAECLVAVIAPIWIGGSTLDGATFPAVFDLSIERNYEPAGTVAAPPPPPPRATP